MRFLPGKNRGLLPKLPSESVFRNVALFERMSEREIGGGIALSPDGDHLPAPARSGCRYFGGRIAPSPENISEAYGAVVIGNGVAFTHAEKIAPLFARIR